MRTRVTMPVLLLVFGAVLLLAFNAQASLDGVSAHEEAPSEATLSDGVSP